MTRHFIARNLTFYLTHPTACPYLPDRLERKAFTPLIPPDSSEINDVLTHAGFRRSQQIAYRPACEGCEACVATRVVADQFVFARRWRKVMARNADVSRHLRPPIATEEQFWLLKDYLDSRHAEGGMAEMGMAEFACMVEESPVRTHVIEYRFTAGEQKGDLAGFALVDLLNDGLSLVYSAFDPIEPRRSLGSYIVLDHIAQAQMMRLPHVYLGYWIRGSEKMDYKAQFQPMELLRGGVWRPFEDTELGERLEG